MAEYEYFQDLWPPNKVSLFEGDETLCGYAEHFLGWAEKLVANVTANPNSVAVNQAYLQLLHKYHEWRVTVPKNHRNRMNESGHTCIFHIFEGAYQALRAVELSLTPPLLYIPEPTSPREVIYTPLILGEED
jgi:hypothetical protein